MVIEAARTISSRSIVIGVTTLVRLSMILVLGERHRRRAIAEFAAHYHAGRNHQSIGNELISAARSSG
jgi:hypothetical protein